MTNDPQALVSIVVPIYNASKYLDQCLDSIQNQTHKNLEIVCINDGSKDNSLEIIQAHAASDPRIVVVDKANEGYGTGCNKGLELAHGEWFSVIEPDDWIELGMYQDMLDFASGFDAKIDIVKTPWTDICCWDDPKTQYAARSIMQGRVKTSTEPFTIAENPVLMELHPSIWSAIYRTEFLREKNIKFPTYPGAGWADNPFLVETLCQAEAIVYMDTPYYNYRCDLPGSTLNHATDEAVARPFDRWIDMMHIIDRLGITDTRILAAHYVRGFNYTFGAIHDDGEDNPVVQAKAAEVFAMMDPDLVLSIRNIAPYRKRYFFKVRGLPVPKISNKPWYEHLMSETKLTLKNEGVRRFVQRAINMGRHKEIED